MGFIPAASATPGDLDPDFGTAGLVRADLGGGNNESFAMAIQSDGKIVVVGYIAGGSSDFVVRRYETDGDLDPTFGTDGMVVTDFSSGDEAALGVAIQSDGKIIVVGYTAVANSQDFAVARYETDGDLDPTFSSDGKVTTDIDSKYNSASALAIQANGEILVAGTSSTGGAGVIFTLVRYTTTGSVDTSVTTSFGASPSIATSIAIQSSGKIIVGGSVGTDFALARYKSDLTLDETFGTGGLTTPGISNTEARINSIALQSTGEIVAAGYGQISGVYKFVLSRYTTDGLLDDTFGDNGVVTTAIGDGDDSGVASVAIQNDGKIVAGGWSVIDGIYIFAVMRYESDGSNDSTFGDDGLVTTNVNDGDGVESYITGLKIQSDGKIVVSGTAGMNAGNFTFALARYMGSGTNVPDAPTLNSVTGGDRKVVVSFTAGADNGSAITDYEYSLNGGAYTSAGTTTSPFTINGLNGRSSYTITIKAKNSAGLSIASASRSARTTDSSLDASDAAAAAEAQRQRELTELLSVIPTIAGLALNLGTLTNDVLGVPKSSSTKQKCVKGTKTKYVKKGAKCPAGYKKKK